MSSETITRNDLTAILNEVLPASTDLPIDVNDNNTAIGIFQAAPDDGDGVYFGKNTMREGPTGIDVGYWVRNTEQNHRILFGVGEGGINHGIYSYALNAPTGRWMIYSNGTDVWVNSIKMLTSSNTEATKYGSVWTGGHLYLYRRGNVVQCVGSPTLTAVSARTQFATIPEGYRPMSTVYAHSNDMSHYFIFDTSGKVQTGASDTAGTKYFSTMWICV